MNIAICYLSQHHGNTQKVVQAMAQGQDVDLIDITAAETADLSAYDLVGFASGIYAFEFSPQAVQFLKDNLPQGKPVFFVYTYGGLQGTGCKHAVAAAREKGCPVLGEFSCRGYVTYGPFRLIGGAGKDRPNQEDLARAQAFFRDLVGRAAP